MKPAELAAELARGKLRPAYLLAGAEPLLRDDALEAIEAAVLDAGPRDFNLDRLEIGRCEPGRLEEALGTLPVMAARRLVVLREGDGRGGKVDGGWATLLEQRLGQAEDGDATSVLVVVAEKVDKRNRWVKAFAAPAALVECDPPKGGRELATFIAEEARRQGVELEPEAAGLLGERVGPQLLLLRHEIEKAELLAGPGSRVTRAHVEQTVAAVAVELLAKLLAQGAAAPAILGALASHFRRLVRVGNGESVPGPPFVVRKLEQQARRYPARRLVACLRAIHRADVELKGASPLGPDRALEQLVLSLAG